jgi:hypothetical protein
MAYDTAGDPMGVDLNWTHRTTEKISAHFAEIGIDVSPNTVGRLLKTQGYALRVNHKKKCASLAPASFFLPNGSLSQPSAPRNATKAMRIAQRIPRVYREKSHRESPSAMR